MMSTVDRGDTQALQTFPSKMTAAVCVVASVLALILIVLSIANASSSSSRGARGQKSDVPFILCETCSQVAKAAASAVNSLQTPSELSVLDYVEGLCNAQSEVGTWARKLDLVEVGTRLRVVQKDSMQKCNVECGTLALACRDVIDSAGETEFAEMLFAARSKGNVDPSSVQNWLCAKKEGKSGACERKPPRMSRSREKGPKFEAISKRDLEVEQLMEKVRAMQGQQGMPNMQMMNRKDAQAFAQDNDDDDDDGDDDGDDSKKREAGVDPINFDSKRKVETDVDPVKRQPVLQFFRELPSVLGQMYRGTLSTLTGSAKQAYSVINERIGQQSTQSVAPKKEL